MVLQKSIQDFLAQKKLAVIGVSRDSRQFSCSAYRLLKTRGFTVYPVNPYTERIENDRCYPNVKSLPEQIGSVLVMLPPEKIMNVLPEIIDAGIKHVWLQQRTESPKAIQYCKDHNINVVHGECIIMFAEPLSFPHSLHRWVKKAAGSLPK